ncbi:MAG: ABC transporter permease, partial [Nakamurella sp.]
MTTLTGTRLLVRLTIRRDRVMLPLWIGALVATVAATVSAFADLYPDERSRNAFGASIAATAVFRAFYGPLLSTTSNGALTAWRMGVIGAVVLALMSTFLITRHTRREEETGRLELVGSAAIGRSAPLVAALIVAVVANVVAGLLCSVTLVVAGEDATGAIVFGLALAGGGAVFAGLAAVAAQLTETARAANGLTLGVLGAAFLVRAVGDGTAGLRRVRWLSPLGWVEEGRAFAGNRIGVIALLVAATAVSGAVAVYLNGRRDLGGSLLRTRPGPATASRSLAGPVALMWRRQRGAILGWAAAFIVLGAVFGALAGSIGSLIETSPQMAEILRAVGGPGVLVDGYFAGVLGVVALSAAGFGVSAMLRLRSDETALLVEPVLATQVSRLRLLAVQAVPVFAVPAVLVLLAGATAGMAANATLTDGVDHLGRLLAGAAVQLPAVWVVGGAAVLVFGVIPRWAALAWGVLALSALLTEVGPVLNLPQLVLDISPFTSVPRLISGAGVPVLPLVV